MHISIGARVGYMASSIRCYKVCSALQSETVFHKLIMRVLQMAAVQAKLTLINSTEHD